MEVLIPLLGGVVVVVLLIVGWKREQRRRERLRAFALSQGWQFSDRDDAWVHRFTGEPFDNGGKEHKACNVMVGAHAGLPLVAFDFSYVTESHDSKGRRSETTHRYAVCALELATALSTVQVTGENLLTRAGALLGMDDIELESEDFNRRFRVSASDRKFACDVLSPRTMEALLRLPAVNWRIEGNHILGWASGRMLPADLMGRASTLAAVVAGVPSFVWRDHGAPAPGGPVG